MPLVMHHLSRFGSIECSRIDARATAYPRHTHEEYVLSANLRGAEQIWYDGRQQQVLAGEVTLYNPMTVQASQFCEQGAQFISLHLDARQVRDMLGQTASSHALPVFQEGVLRDPGLFGAIVGVYEQPWEGREEAQLALFSELLRFRTTPAPADEPLRVTRLIDFMQANLYAPIGLDDLCAQVHLSRFHLVRSFKAIKHLPPMQYLQQLRLIEARRRLRLGDAAACVAMELGFFDQAHLSNAFRKVMGTSPQGYRSMPADDGWPKNSR